MRVRFGDLLGGLARQPGAAWLLLDPEDKPFIRPSVLCP
jgi:hypothetical protein